MTIKNLLTQFSHPDADILLAHVISKSREFIISHPEYTVSFFDAWRYKKCVQKRKSGMPVAYITGEKEFYGLNFFVNKHTLVPRPETEILVEKVIEEIKNYDENIIMIDVGTGSGCIPISIIKNVPEKNITAFALDISKPALQMAQKNAAAHNINIQFLHGNLLEPISEKIISHCIITANLPYLREDQFTTEPSIQHEPKSALVANDNGLALYKELLTQIQKIFPTQNITLFLEIDPSQKRPLQKYIQDLFPKAQIEIINDYRDQARVIKIKKTA